MGNDITGEGLRECLAALPPLELLGMRLLKAHPAAGLFPTNIPRDQLREAVLEVTQYTTDCVALAQRLQGLTPIPLTTYECLEFGL